VKHEFILSGVTLSQNQWDKLHWSERYQIRNEWFKVVKFTIGRKKLRQTQPCSLHLCRVAKRLIDLPNISSPAKPLIDALVHFGWLTEDDHKALVSFTVSQRKCGNEDPHMQVIIEEVESTIEE